MFNVFTFITGFGLIFLFGYKLCRILLPNAEFLELLSLGFFIGSGLFTFLWFILNWFGIPYTLVSGLALLAFLILLDVCFEKFFLKRELKKKIFFDFSYFKKLNLVDKSLLVIIVFLCVSALVQTVYWPIRYWDSMVLYDFRAKVFTQTGFMQDAIARGYFFGYPLFTSLAHTWVYVIGGDNPSFLYGLFYLSFIVLFFFNIKKLNLKRILVLALTLSVAISPRLFDHTQWAYTNLPYSIYIILGSIYLYFGIKQKNFGSFIVSAILIGLSTWTRTAEPFWLSCIVMVVVASLFIRKWLWPFVYTALVTLIMIPWRFFQASYNEGSTNVASQVVSTTSAVAQNLQLSILKPTFDFFMTNVIKMYLIYFVLLGIIILIKLIIKSRKWLFTFLIIVNLGLAFAGTLIFVKYQPYWQEIPDSLARMMMFIPSLVIFLFAVLLSEMKTR